MNRQEIKHLSAERAALERMFADTPDEDVIDRRSISARLDYVSRLLASVVETRTPVRAQLTFRGRPVVGSHGIFAEFGMTATKAFTDAVIMLAGALEVPLRATGPIPNRGQNQLLITSTALGSFGFELEEHRFEEPADLLPDEDSPVAIALSQTRELFQVAASGNDDELTDVAAGQEERVLAAMRAFLKTLVDNEAVCSVTVGDNSFRFSDVGEVRRSFDRLAQDNLHEVRRALPGQFQGALPSKRTFEFRLTEGGDVITGKIAPTVGDPGAINHHLYEGVTIDVIEKRVGQGKPRFVLPALPPWQGEATGE